MKEKIKKNLNIDSELIEIDFNDFYISKETIKKIQKFAVSLIHTFANKEKEEIMEQIKSIGPNKTVEFFYDKLFKDFTECAFWTDDEFQTLILVIIIGETENFVTIPRTEWAPVTEYKHSPLFNYKEKTDKIH